MEKVAFILGAGAHVPFEFPTGERLKELVAEELSKPPHDQLDEYASAKRALLDCGVSIDRFLATKKAVDQTIRPLIAKVLLYRESKSLDAGMKDWLAYIWPLMIDSSRQTVTNQFSFITFNYDRTTEYRIARAASALWDIPLIDACNMMDNYGIYHVYGSLGGIGPRSQPHVEYGRRDGFATSGRQIKIIGEHAETTTKEIHDRLADASLILVLGCGFHPENMRILALDQLPAKPARVILASCTGLSGQERSTATTLYPYMSFFREDMNALTALKECGPFQTIRTSIMQGQ